MAQPRVSQFKRRRSVLLGMDQAISSTSNFATTFALASLLATAEFGAYALSAGLFGLALAGGRLTSSERLTVVGARGRAAVLTASTFAVGVASILASLVLWAVVGDLVVLAWAVAAFPVLLQDRLRFVAISRRLSAAIAGDTVWLALSLALWPVAAVFQFSSALSAVLITSAPPLASSLLLIVLLRRDVSARVERDLRESVAEFHFVVDSWLQIAAVFVALALTAVAGSLVTVGRARALMLLFQPFVSISYAGRLIVLGSSDEARIRRWPSISVAACAVYALLIGLVLVAVNTVTKELGDLWTFGIAAFVLMAIAQCARSFHQSVADLQRRARPQRLLRSRAGFAVVLVGTVGPLVSWYGLNGLTLAWAMAYLIGAWMVRRRMPARSSDDC